MELQIWLVAIIAYGCILIYFKQKNINLKMTHFRIASMAIVWFIVFISLELKFNILITTLFYLIPISIMYFYITYSYNRYIKGSINMNANKELWINFDNEISYFSEWILFVGLSAIVVGIFYSQ
jgi:hypothetical protein